MPRNILADRDGVLLDMADVESVDCLGQVWPNDALAWAERQFADTGYSVTTALRVLKGYRPDAPCGEVVYGSGGMNRWVIFPDGRVCFSGYHSHHYARERAEALGFDIN